LLGHLPPLDGAMLLVPNRKGIEHAERGVTENADILALDRAVLHALLEEIDEGLLHALDPIIDLAGSFSDTES
jgi:hypothetical protein